MILKPRAGVKSLQQSTLSQFLIGMGLVIIYFIQVASFVLSIEKYTFAPLLSFKGLILAFYLFLFLSMGVFVVIQASTLAFWLAAKCFNGQGTLPQTRCAVIWTLMGSIPIGFFWVIFYSAYKYRELLGKTATFIGAISYVGALATLIYMLIVLLITISETNQIKLGRAFFSLVLGSLILIAMSYILLPVYHFLSP